MNSPSPSRPTLKKLEAAARRSARSAYAPYSGFRVGSAVLCGSGRIYSGCNVENASYGLCACAERNAVASAIGAGESTIRAVAVYTPTETPTSPCGACRQVIHEFGPGAYFFSVCDSGRRIESSISELLPASFGPKDLVSAEKPAASPRPSRRDGGRGARARR